MNANAARLAGLTKDLLNRWRQTREYWRDAKSLEFEQKYLAELTSSVDRAVGVIDQLDKLLAKIRRDCE
jgi:hypothetical protein